MLVLPQWSSARLYHYGQSLTRPCRLHHLLRPFRRLNSCREKRQVAFASAAAASAIISHDNNHSFPPPDAKSSSSLEGAAITPAPKNISLIRTLKSYSQQLRTVKESAGHEGVIELWNELKSREVRIKSTSIYGRLLWEEFWEVGLVKRSMREDLWQYALDHNERIGDVHLGLYAAIVSRFLCDGRAQLAWEWHKLIKDNYPTPERRFFSLLTVPNFNIAHLSKTSNDMLELLYKEGDERNLYDLIVPQICSSGRYKRAFRWHEMLLRSNDFPSPDVAESPQIMAMFTDYVTVSLTATTERDVANATSSTVQEQHYEPIKPTSAEPTSPQEDESIDPERVDTTREGRNRNLGEAHGIKEKRIDDDFCARLFATGILPVGVVISGLAAVGVDALGPTALRELAVRASNRQGFLESLHALKDAKISVKPCVYSNLILRAAHEDSDDLFGSILTTDQHPDVFEDIELQQRLLHSYIASKDWLQAHRTLMIIAILRPVQKLQLSPTGSAWNFVLSSNTTRARDPAVTHLLNQLLVNRIPVDDVALQAIRQKYLKSYHPRRPDLYLDARGHHELVDPADLSLVLNVLLRSQVAVRPISPRIWRGILQRLGMLGRYQEFARLSIWLANTYPHRVRPTEDDHVEASASAFPVSGMSTSSGQIVEDTISLGRNETSTIIPSTQTSEKEGPLDVIFSLSTQFSIVAWGMLGFLPRAEKVVEKSADWFSNNQNPDCELWACGIKLLKILQEDGAPIHTDTVRTIVEDRLWMLFGTARFTRWENRVARESNPYSLAHMINHVNDIVWPGLFDYIAPFLLQEGTEWSEDLFHTVFRRQLLKRENFWERAGKHRMLKWGNPFKTHWARLRRCRKFRRLSSVKGIKLRRAWYLRDRWRRHL